MGKSKKKQPYFWYCGRSAKRDKRRCNRIFRKISRLSIAKGAEPPHSLKEAMDAYEFATDGKQFWKTAPAKFLRK